MGWKGTMTTIPVGMKTRKMYCKNCGERLKVKKNTRLVKKRDKDFYDRNGINRLAIGMTSFDRTTYIYRCTVCRSEITYSEQCYVEKEQKRTNSRILHAPLTNYHTFSTQTIPKYYRRPFYFIMLLLLPISAVISAIVGRYVDGSYGFGMFLTCLLLLVFWHHNVKLLPPMYLQFIGTRLHVRDKYNVEFDIYALTKDDFLFKQNAIQKRKNIGHLQIRNSDYKFVGIGNYDELVRYINENF